MAAVEQPQVEMEGPVPDADSEQLQAEKDGPSNEQVPQDFCVEILPLVKESQNQHGLRHGDYRSYRLYCSRRVRRIRKSLHFTQGRKHRYVGKALTVEMVSDVRYLHIPLVCAERAWAYAMQLKQEAESDLESRQKHHLQRKLQKAQRYAQELLELCEACPRCDPRTRLEAEAYAKWMHGNLYFECQDWKDAFDCFGSAQTIYEQLARAVLEEHRIHYHQRVDEIAPSIRYCAYNIGDMPSDVKELTKLRVSMPGYELLASKIDLVIAQTRATAATTLTEVHWCGRKVPVKSERLRISLVHLQELRDEVGRKGEGDDSTEQLCEQVLLECHDTLQVIRDELTQEKREEERRSVKAESQQAHLADIQNYVTHIKLTHSIRRTLLLVRGMQEGQRRGRPEEFVRLYDSLLQNSSDLENLPGLSEQLEQQKQIVAQSFTFRAHRAFFLAESYAEGGKLAEAMVLYDRALEHISQASKLNAESSHAAKEVHLAELQRLSDRARGQKCVAQVSLFGGEEKEKAAAFDSVTPLSARLDEVLHVSADKKLPPLAPLPPEMQPIPSKPLFFDLAKNYIELPDLEHRFKEDKSKEGGGITGFMRGWLWGGKK